MILVRWAGFEPAFTAPVTANGLEVRPGYQRMHELVGYHHLLCYRATCYAKNIWKKLICDGAATHRLYRHAIPVLSC